MDAKDAKDALDQISFTKDEVARRWKAPKGYYALLGFALWLDIVAIVLPFPWGIVAVVVSISIIIATVGWYARIAGMWAFADLRGKGSWIFWTMVAVAIAGFVGAVLVDSVKVAAILGGIVFVTWSALGPIWDRAAQPAGA